MEWQAGALAYKSVIGREADYDERDDWATRVPDNKTTGQGARSGEGNQKSEVRGQRSEVRDLQICNKLDTAAP
jgi:hypothetical protein